MKTLKYLIKSLAVFMTSCTGKACAAFGVKITVVDPQAGPLMAPLHVRNSTMYLGHSRR